MCASLPEGERPRVPRPTDEAPRKPRCATHRRAVAKAAKTRSRATYVRVTYGLPEEAYEALKGYQRGRCYICWFANGSRKALAVDHDHACCADTPACGRCVRGLLCGPDNELVGRALLISQKTGSSPTEVLLRAIAYLEDPPMSRLRRQGLVSVLPPTSLAG